MMNNYKLLTLLSVSIVSHIASADNSINNNFFNNYATDSQMGQSLTATDLLADNATPVNYSPAAQPAAKAQDDQASGFLPFWGDEARAAGYDLPDPYGVGVNYMNIRQNIDVQSINFSNLAYGSLQIPSSLIAVNAGKTREKSKTETMKLDTWVLPFMDVYGVLGHTRGSSVSDVSVDSNPAQFSGINQIISQAVHGMSQSGQLQNLNFKLDFKGTTYGLGTTLVYGYDNWFASLDQNYTRTDFDILDGDISAYTLTPRVGYSFTVPAMDTLHMAPSKLNVWVGSMYQDVQQTFKDNLSDLNMPPELEQLMTLADGNGDGRFKVKQHLTTPWNMLVGAQYEVTRNFNITSEVGFTERNSFYVAGEYRF